MTRHVRMLITLCSRIRSSGKRAFLHHSVPSDAVSNVNMHILYPVLCRARRNERGHVGFVAPEDVFRASLGFDEYEQAGKKDTV